jgi:16S rRNA (guanine966-N2)-methyltransferase
VLDLFAASGALGIEALSRGAAHAVFVEQSRAAVRVLRRNLDDLGLRDESEVLPQDALRALRALAVRGDRFGLVLADPPWGRDWPARLAGSPELVEILEPRACLILERSKRDTHAGIAGLGPAATRTYGETVFDAYETAEGEIREGEGPK